MTPEKKRGFAAMDENKQREIARRGGKAAHQKGTAHRFTPEEAKVAGKKGGQARARARTSGGAIFETLHSDHQSVSEQMTEIVKDPQARERLYPQMRDALDAHASAEEDVLYPQLEAKPESQQSAEQAKAEHAEVHTLLAQLDALKKTDPQWESLFLKLQTAVEKHVEEEEHEIFEEMRRLFTPQELERLAQAFSERKARHLGSRSAA